MKRPTFFLLVYRGLSHICQFTTQTAAVKASTFYLLLSSRCSQLKYHRTRLENMSSYTAVQEDCTLPLWFICDVFKRGICSPALNEILCNDRSLFLSVISLIFHDIVLLIQAIVTVSFYVAYMTSYIVTQTL
jgi:hypothetical protein